LTAPAPELDHKSDSGMSHRIPRLGSHPEKHRQKKSESETDDGVRRMRI